MTQLDIRDQLQIIHQDFLTKFSQIRNENEAIKSRLKNIETMLDTDNAIRHPSGGDKDDLTTYKCGELGKMPKA